MSDSKFIRRPKVKSAADLATEEFLRLKHSDQMGQKVLVERSALEGERTEQLREVLADIGKDLQQQGPDGVSPTLEYLGSFSVHVYYSNALKAMCFATLNNLGKVHFNVAEDACRELFGTVCENYGQKRPVRRSGAS